MKKYRTVLYLSFIICGLLSLSGCSMLKKSKTHMVYSDSNRKVSLVGGTGAYSIGMVLDDKELLVCDETGSERFRKKFTNRISYLDMIGDVALLAFDNGNVEIYRCNDEQSAPVSKHSFDAGIIKAELMRNSSAVVLLDNGELWKTTGENFKEFIPVDTEVKDVAYEIRTEAILYVTENGQIKCISNGYRLSTEVESISGVVTIEDAYLYSEKGLAIRFLVVNGTESRFMAIDQETKELYLSEKYPEFDPGSLDVSKTIPEGVSYRINGETFYEGTSYNERRVYGYEYNKRLALSIPKGYNTCAIMGGVILYNDHEVKVLLIE
ncbi:MAG: hypothetical protein IKX04_02295 [Clostridiales bacterium]|nr:hypothetical protein [Clostridiales bacterium]MBR4819573.1 hypothetical protein [Clostridiales bacterium]MBR5039567.1 hypothetical protein [Clostridiales bacterium]MBR5057373.1 hypothetical protein [Clostridiales bacterium]